jgi:glycosyltransferase involved in cell wall biosynthesis
MDGLANESAGRRYFLPLLSSCFEGCPICGWLGCRASEDRDRASWVRALSRAQSGEYQTLVFPANLLSHPEAEEILARARDLGFRTVLRIHEQVLGSIRDPRLERWIADGLELDLILTFREPAESSYPIARYTWLVLKRRWAPLDFLKRLPSPVREKLVFYFPPFDGEQTYSVGEVYRLLERVRRAFPELAIRSPEGLEIWDSRISPSLCLEGNEAPVFSYGLDGVEPEISVIVPSYNSGLLLENTVRHLLAQSLERRRFEIIVVDDGSTDGTADRIRNFVAPEAGSIQFKYLYFPRAEARKLGDGKFRAGISRNLGVKHARGRLLAFLDSDIIVPPHYLESLIEQHRTHDVVQCIRRHLKDADEWVSYGDVDPHRETYVLEKRYWGPFFEASSWQSLPFFWKYTCTYSLSLAAEDFKRAGWFRKTFVFYGFEDTDLGYRLWKAGKKFHLHPLVTYHLSSRTERREYRKSEFDRFLLLSKTAKIFYLNTLDPVVYRHFQSFMGGERRFLRVLSEATSEAWRRFTQSFKIAGTREPLSASTSSLTK